MKKVEDWLIVAASMPQPYHSRGGKEWPQRASACFEHTFIDVDE